jgi:hypothetical protein
MTPVQQQLSLEPDVPQPLKGGDSGGDSTPGGPAPAPVWLQRMSLVVLVLFCFYIGGLLAVLPWSPRYWDQNGWLLAHPAIEAILERGWVRGIVSGVGLIDIWIGISELLHYRDHRI